MAEPVTFFDEYGDIPAGLCNEANCVTGMQVCGTANISVGKIYNRNCQESTKSFFGAE